MMPSCDQIGVPIHFHSSTTSGSASLMSLRILLRVSPRQSPSSAILREMSSEPTGLGSRPTLSCSHPRSSRETQEPVHGCYSARSVARRAGTVKCYETITVGRRLRFRLLQCRHRQVSDDVHERGEAWHRASSLTFAGSGHISRYDVALLATGPAV